MIIEENLLGWNNTQGQDQAGPGSPLQSRPGLSATEHLNALRVRPTPSAPIPSATSRPGGRKVDSSAAPPRPGASHPRTDWTLRDFLPVSPLSDKNLTPDPIAWRKAAVAQSGSTRRHRNYSRYSHAQPKRGSSKEETKRAHTSNTRLYRLAP